MVAHHVANGLGFEDFELATEREKERDEFVIRDDIDANAILLIVIVLRGVQGFILDIRIAVGRDTHNDMLYVLALRDSDTDDIIKVLVEIDVVRFLAVLGEHR